MRTDSNGEAMNHNNQEETAASHTARRWFWIEVIITYSITAGLLLWNLS